MAQTVHVSGLRELEKALKELPRATGKAVLRRVLLKRAQPIADHASSIAPDDPQTGGNDLKSSIAVSTKLSKRQRGLHKKIKSKSAVEMFVGAGPVPHAHLQEFGSAVHGPQAYMRPAWDAGKGPLLDGLKDDLWTEIEATAKRRAKRQAKLAAKG